MGWSSHRGEELPSWWNLCPRSSSEQVRYSQWPLLRGVHVDRAWDLPSTSRGMTPGGCPWLEWVAQGLVWPGGAIQQHCPAGDQWHSSCGAHALTCSAAAAVSLCLQFPMMS